MGFVKTHVKKLYTHRWFFLLLGLAAIIRLEYISDGVFPFDFDHGKDAIAIFDLLVNQKIKLVGPWTSIPGLYFGPAWYYFLAPFYLIGGFDPYWSVIAMTLLVLIQMWLAYKYFSIESAVLIGFSSYWMTISRSAWNPFPMTLISLIIVILLMKIINSKETNVKIIAGIFFTSSLGFHFSSAFAIFYPVIIVITFLIYRVKLRLKELIVGIFAFCIPFIPQLLFELRHNFIQTRSVFTYFSQGEKQTVSLQKLDHVIDTIIGEFQLLIFRFPGTLEYFSLSVFLLFVAVGLFFLLKKKLMNRRFKQLVVISCLFIVIPIIGFSFLHFNVWYVLPAVPIATLLVGSIISKAPKWISIVFIVVYVNTAFYWLDYFQTRERPMFLTARQNLPVKQRIIAYIRESAGTQPFAVYTYMGDVYDYPYQFLFFKDTLKGKKLPTEFSYQPNRSEYVVEKPNILAGLAEQNESVIVEESPELIFFIVTADHREFLVQEWWNHQKYGEIIKEQKFGNTVSVFIATPSTE